MRILRGLSSRVLPCGCLAGLYETYDGEIVGILDAKGQACDQAQHASGNSIPVDQIRSESHIGPPSSEPSIRSTPKS
jgi:hypothetical protein